MRPLIVRGVIFTTVIGGFVFLMQQVTEEFERVGSGVAFTPIKGIATQGPFEHTRNPLYSYMLVAIAGLAVAVDEVLLFMVVPAFFGYLYRSIIPYEEALLLSKFGEAYSDYLVSTPRWFGFSGKGGDFFFVLIALGVPPLILMDHFLPAKGKPKRHTE
jgi:protein-S-isoprenylcysteine O-methyltransferase Ste14